MRQPNAVAGFSASKDREPVEMLPGITRRMVSEGSAAMAVHITIEKGREVPLHTHPHEQIGYLQTGRARFTIGNDVRELEALDGYSIPGGTPHGVVALEDCVFVDVFTPPRDEYRH
jgi:quercetin dioxygenase-like cupin family protein